MRQAKPVKAESGDKSEVYENFLAQIAFVAMFFPAAAGKAQVTILQQPTNNYVAFEAESRCAIIDVKGLGKTWVELTLAGASNGKALGANTDNTAEMWSYARYNIQMVNPGTYHFYLRYAC